MTTRNMLSKLLGTDNKEGIDEREFGALDSIMTALKKCWPEIKTAREAQKGGEANPQPAKYSFITY